MKNVIKAFSLVGLLFVSGAASAALVNEEVASNAYITIGGYDVAWAAPCAAVDPSCGVIDLSFQAAFGWQIMTLDVWNEIGGVSAYDFVVEGGNVDFFSGNNLDEATGATLHLNGATGPEGDLAIAAPYFSNLHTWGDWNDALRDYWDPISDLSWSEGLVFRVSNANVPEASGLALLAIGLLGLGMGRRRA